MKKITKITSLLLCVVIAFAFTSCKKADEPSDNKNSDTVYYDKNAVAYDNMEDVKFYDKNGDVYLLSIGEDYMPDYINQSTGEKYNGFDCYVDEDGYFVYDSTASFKLKSGTMSTYNDANGNTYYQIASVEWDSSGKMTVN